MKNIAIALLLSFVLVSCFGKKEVDPVIETPVAVTSEEVVTPETPQEEEQIEVEEICEDVVNFDTLETNEYVIIDRIKELQKGENQEIKLSTPELFRLRSFMNTLVKGNISKYSGADISKNLYNAFNIYSIIEDIEGNPAIQNIENGYIVLIKDPEIEANNNLGFVAMLFDEQGIIVEKGTLEAFESCDLSIDFGGEEGISYESIAADFNEDGAFNSIVLQSILDTFKEAIY